MSDKPTHRLTPLYTKAETVEQLINEIQQLKFSESLTISDETVACLGANAKHARHAKSMENEQIYMLAEENNQNKASIRDLHVRFNRMRDCLVHEDSSIREETEQRAKYYGIVAVGIGWATVAAVSLAHFVLSH